MKPERVQFYRLEYLITKKELLILQEVAEKHGISFPEVVAVAVSGGIRTLRRRKVMDRGRLFEAFGGWISATLAEPSPPPTTASRILTEMFLKWGPVCHKDFEDGLKSIEDEKKRKSWRLVFNWWVDFCRLNGISPTLLVDHGARW